MAYVHRQVSESCQPAARFSLVLKWQHVRNHTDKSTYCQAAFLFITQCLRQTDKPSPGEIKRREVSWTLTKKLARKRSRAGRWCRAGRRVGLLSLHLFPHDGTTDIVIGTLFCIEVGTAIAWCCGRCAMQDGHCLNILFFWRRSTAALVVRVGA